MSADNHSWDRELDLHGEVCPYTFVKTKLALEEMCSGQVLRVLLDYRPSVDNVPRSASGEGHAVLEVVEVGKGSWVVTIRKA